VGTYNSQLVLAKNSWARC